MHHRHLRLHNRGHIESIWNDFTSAIGDGFGRSTSQKSDGGHNGNGSNGNDSQGPSTVTQYVYMTQVPPGYTGPLTTVDSSTSDQKTTSKEVVHTATTSAKPETKPTTSAQKTSSKLPSSIVPTTKESIRSTLGIATNTPTPSSQLVTSQTSLPTAASAVAATTSAAILSSESQNNASNSSGTSAGAKAGIAIGVLAGIFVVFLVAFLAFRHRKKQLEARRLGDDNEKSNPFADTAPPALAPAATPAPAPAPASAPAPQAPHRPPRLSLRPGSQFGVPWGANNSAVGDKRMSKGAVIPMVTTPGRNLAAEPPMQENPFGENAERLNDSTHNLAVSHALTPVSERTEFVPVSPMSSGDSPTTAEDVAGEAAGEIGTVAVATMARKASIRKDGIKHVDLTLPPPLSTVPASPAGTEFSMSSTSPGAEGPGQSYGAAAIAAAGGPASTSVHRVQLEFRPTMGDEMELRPGQLVRLLHEYDDGWCLCIRLDRSEQGVCPRTCLSTRPVKPRPAQGPPRGGPPVNPSGPRPRGPNYPPGARPMTPQGGRLHPRPESPMRPMTAGGRPQSPAGIRPQSPAGRPMSPYGGPRSQLPAPTRPMNGGPRSQSPAPGRPMSPGPRAMSPGPRSQSPGPRNMQGRPQSPSGMGCRMSPPGPSAMNQEYRPGPPTGPVGRKPVPGQAM